MAGRARGTVTTRRAEPLDNPTRSNLSCEEAAIAAFERAAGPRRRRRRPPSSGPRRRRFRRQASSQWTSRHRATLVRCFTERSAGQSSTGAPRIRPARPGSEAASSLRMFCLLQFCGPGRPVAASAGYSRCNGCRTST